MCLELQDADVGRVVKLVTGMSTAAPFPHTRRFLLGVVLPLLDVVLPQHFDFVEVVVHLPIDEVDLLQQLLLVEL